MDFYMYLYVTIGERAFSKIETIIKFKKQINKN